MHHDIAQRFRAFAEAHAPLDTIDADVGLIGADLHDIADTIDAAMAEAAAVCSIPQLDLSGGAVGLRPL